MAGRLLLLARGPGVLAVVLVGAVAVTAARRGHTAARQPVPAATPTLASPQFRLALSGAAIAVDPATSMLAWARTARFLSLSAANKSISVGFQMQMRNGSAKPRGFDSGSFYLVATSGSVPSGTTVASTAPDGVPPLGRGTLPPGSIRTGWIAFHVPARTARYVLIWSDADHLLSPASLGTVVIHPSSG